MSRRRDFVAALLRMAALAAGARLDALGTERRPPAPFARLDGGSGRADTGSGSMPPLYQPETPLPVDAAYRVAQTDVRPSLLLPGHHEAWNAAERITWGPPHATTTFSALWNSQGMAMRFNVCDLKPWHTMTKRDQPIWEEEVVEIFLDPTRTGRDYLEVEISPINVVTDLLIRHPWPGLDNDISWDWAGLESTVIPGSCEGMQPDSWVALAWMPWAALERVSPQVAAQSPPKAGDRWKFNVFRIKRPHGPADPKTDAVFAAWSAPDGPSFHAPAFFRDFVFLAPGHV